MNIKEIGNKFNSTFESIEKDQETAAAPLNKKVFTCCSPRFQKGENFTIAAGNLAFKAVSLLSFPFRFILQLVGLKRTSNALNILALGVGFVVRGLFSLLLPFFIDVRHSKARVVSSSDKLDSQRQAQQLRRAFDSTESLNPNDRLDETDLDPDSEEIS